MDRFSLMTRSACVFVPLILLLLVATPASSQIGQLEGLQGQSGSFYKLRTSGQIGMQVAVHGAIAGAGLYELPVGYALTDLLAVAGGLGGQRLSETTRIISVAVYRPSVSASDPLYFVEMENDFRVLLDAPELADGDQVVVGEKTIRGITWRDYISFFSIGLTSLNLILQITRR